jgi:hypothetical protein
MFGICELANIPLRFEANDRSEIVSQVLFGECFEILETIKNWLRVKLHDDHYEGWIDSKQARILSEENYLKVTQASLILNNDLVDYISTKENMLIPIPLGSSLTFLPFPEINIYSYQFEGLQSKGEYPKSRLIETAFLYLNAPYLWGGKTPFGIDCSGFTQMVYKLNGYAILRDASQQSTMGEALSFIEESEPGDLAFFDNEEGKIIHVGLIMNDNYIIHASGKVRVDRLDHLGIFNAETNRHTHKLRVIKRII